MSVVKFPHPSLQRICSLQLWAKYGPMVLFGWAPNGMVLTISGIYRMANQLSSLFSFPALPRIVLGGEQGMYLLPAVHGTHTFLSICNDSLMTRIGGCIDIWTFYLLQIWTNNGHRLWHIKYGLTHIMRYSLTHIQCCFLLSGGWYWAKGLSARQIKVFLYICRL